MRDSLDPRGAAAVLPEPHLLRCLHRGALLLPAFAYVYTSARRAFSMGLPGGRTGCFATRAHTWRSLSRSSDGAEGRAGALRRFDRGRRPRDAGRGDRLARFNSRTTFSVAAWRALRRATCGNTSSIWRIERLAMLGLPEGIQREESVLLPHPSRRAGATNFFERRVSAYQVGVTGEVVLDGILERVGPGPPELQPKISASGCSRNASCSLDRDKDLSSQCGGRTEVTGRNLMHRLSSRFHLVCTASARFGERLQ